MQRIYVDEESFQPWLQTASFFLIVWDCKIEAACVCINLMLLFQVPLHTRRSQGRLHLWSCWLVTSDPKMSNPSEKGRHPFYNPQLQLPQTCLTNGLLLQLRTYVLVFFVCCICVCLRLECICFFYSDFCGHVLCFCSVESYVISVIHTLKYLFKGHNARVSRQAL